MKSKHIITGIGMLICLVFFNVQDAAGQDCGGKHPSYSSMCWSLKVRSGDKELRMARLSNEDLSRIDLRGANLPGAHFTNSNLSNANLSNARLIGARMAGADLTGADLSGADLSGTDLTRANLTKANLTGAIVRRSSTKGINFDDWKKRGAIVLD